MIERSRSTRRDALRTLAAGGVVAASATMPGGCGGVYAPPAPLPPATSTGRPIMIIRHGEKPADSGSPQGIDPDGNLDPHSLIVRGWPRPGPARPGTPDSDLRLRRYRRGGTTTTADRHTAGRPPWTDGQHPLRQRRRDHPGQRGRRPNRTDADLLAARGTARHRQCAGLRDARAADGMAGQPIQPDMGPDPRLHRLVATPDSPATPGRRQRRAHQLTTSAAPCRSVLATPAVGLCPPRSETATHRLV
jgi:hypothetical protein